MFDEKSDEPIDPPLAFYKISREAVDVDAFAEQRARYLKYLTEDAACFSNIWNDPRLEHDTGPMQLARARLSTDECLDAFDAELAAVNPPKTLEDRIIRSRLAEAAIGVFDEFKLCYGLSDHPDLEAKVKRRTDEIHTAWMVNECMGPLFLETQSELPGAASLRHALFMSTTRASPSRNPSISTQSRLRPTYIENLLNTPSVMLEKQFYHRPTTVWEVDKYTVSRGGDIVYKVRLKGCGDDPIRVDRDGLRLMLQESEIKV